VLGTLQTGQDLSATVKAILEDLDTEAAEAAEVLWAVEVSEQGVPVRRLPVVVFDTHERLCYGAEFLEAVVQTGRSVEMLVVRGVQLEDPP
jgi:hypothetical protein